MNRLTPIVLVPILSLAALAAAAGCAREADAKAARPAPPATTPSPARTARAEWIDPTDLVGCNTWFALDLYAALAATDDGNIVVSPQSISTALAMTYAGARGETAEQMRRTLHFGLPPEALHPAFAGLEQSMLDANDDDAEVEIALANRLWGRVDMTFLQEFLDITRDSYRGGFETLDFKSAAEQARQSINAWVERNTNDRIRDLLQPGDVDDRTSLVLTNAIWFKGRWRAEFDPAQTRDGIFHAPGDRGLTAAMMSQTAFFRYHEDATLQLVELPYDGDRFSLVVLLPRARDGLAALEEALTVERLDGWLEAMSERQPRKVALTLPRFRATARYDLVERLSGMGMPIAFGGGAEFSGMTTEARLFIKRVIHQALIEVNERGTEAAAATAVGMMPTSFSPPVEFAADHPFVYLVRDRETGSVMFLGRVCDPGE